MLQHLTSRSLASLRNNFECLRNVQTAGQHNLLHPVQNTTQSRTEILLISKSSSQDHPPNKKNVLDDVQLFGLVAWVLFGKLPQQWLVLLCLLRILLRVIVQPWTAHFHSQHPHRLVVYKSHVLSVGSNESVFCVNRNIPVCLTVYWLVQRFGLHLWGGTESASLRPRSMSKNSTLSAELCLSMYLVCASDEHPAKTWVWLSGTFLVPHILHKVLIWSEVQVL